MEARDLVDVAIDEDPRAPCLWVPSELWPEFLAAIRRRPNLIGAVIYRGKTIREGGPLTDITTRRPPQAGWPATTTWDA
jgi:hypothetical protein